MADLTYRSPKTEVRHTPIHVKGLFAIPPERSAADAPS